MLLELYVYKYSCENSMWGSW